MAQVSRAGASGGPGKLAVDRPLWAACGSRGAVTSLAKQLGLTSLEVITPEGSYQLNWQEDRGMCFANNLTVENETLANASWSAVERAIRALNGTTRTLVTLGPPPPLGPPEGDHHMAVGGGEGGRCLVYFTEDNLDFHTLVEGESRNDHARVRMVVGGQEGDSRAWQFVGVDTAVEAARHYFNDGSQQAKFEWVKGAGDAE